MGKLFPVVGSCENFNETFGSTKGGEFLHYNMFHSNRSNILGAVISKRRG
jgi:hypothetical protein